MSIKWLSAFVLCATSGCITRQQLAAERASREFHCPEPQIVTVARPDIFNDVIDVRACGQVARYSCFQERRYAPHCVREPLFEASPLVP
jgi:hypothetical protein